MKDKNDKSAGFEAQKDFWENAGEIGYGKAIFTSSVVERHIISKQWNAAIETARALGVEAESTILELGCGDGAFVNTMLSKRFRHIDAYDASIKAVESARKKSVDNNVSFHVKDLIHFEYDRAQRWDAAFLIGFLHHVKPHTAEIITRLSKVAPKVIVVEPNGDNLIRKGLELRASYRRAGEDSFKLDRLTKIFKSNGYRMVVSRRLILVPSMLPTFMFSLLKAVEAIVETSPYLNRLCSTYILGFERE